jgi:hypothetical protein
MYQCALILVLLAIYYYYIIITAVFIIRSSIFLLPPPPQQRYKYEHHPSDIGGGTLGRGTSQGSAPESTSGSVCGRDDQESHGWHEAAREGHGARPESVP